eukprot:m.217583 g.217583  ORF g.217583 m.217583 type:complete len:387 (-) comp19131_c0_seq4:887-2047(-)
MPDDICLCPSYQVLINDQCVNITTTTTQSTITSVSTTSTVSSTSSISTVTTSIELLSIDSAATVMDSSEPFPVVIVSVVLLLLACIFAIVVVFVRKRYNEFSEKDRNLKIYEEYGHCNPAYQSEFAEPVLENGIRDRIMLRDMPEFVEQSIFGDIGDGEDDDRAQTEEPIMEFLDSVSHTEAGYLDPLPMSTSSLMIVPNSYGEEKIQKSDEPSLPGVPNTSVEKQEIDDQILDELSLNTPINSAYLLDGHDYRPPNKYESSESLNSLAERGRPGNLLDPYRFAPEYSSTESLNRTVAVERESAAANDRARFAASSIMTSQPTHPTNGEDPDEARRRRVQEREARFNKKKLDRQVSDALAQETKEMYLATTGGAQLGAGIEDHDEC